MIRRLHGYAIDKLGGLAEQVGQLARDVDDSLKRRPEATIIERDVTWEEPFELDVGSIKPRIVDCVRAIDTSDATARPKPSAIYWDWNNQGLVEIASITGLSVATDYSLTFLVVW